MTNVGIFLVGSAITLVVLIAGGILSYGIALENRALVAEAAAAESSLQAASNEASGPVAEVLDLRSGEAGHGARHTARPLATAGPVPPQAA